MFAGEHFDEFARVLAPVRPSFGFSSPIASFRYAVTHQQYKPGYCAASPNPFVHSYP
jgi:hypothetical protein